MLLTWYDTKTVGDTRKELAKCEDATLFDAHGDYLYYDAYKGLNGADAYALNVKTRKRQFMVRGVKSATCSNGRAITTSHHNVGINLPVYSFKANGKGKKILDATEIRVSDKCIVYVTIGETGATYKKYSCDLNGKNRKYLGNGNGTL